MNTHIIIPITNLKEKKDKYSYVHNEIIERIKSITIDCPECETIIHDDEQYQCGTCEGSSKIYVLNWIKNQGKSIYLEEKDIEKQVKKAEKYQEEVNGAAYPPYFYKGYKQALKDLILFSL